ncbi:peptidylprolyl isomerase [Hydrogenimonas sp.]|uniref:peptidylprolyl isomerase n=1 Tax=Hydrogenimonas sp. TaxID=2231112 RepID=UPI00263A206A|nr:peptidylprolyl isomerase [Hydrogenimonas sp.]
MMKRFHSLFFILILSVSSVVGGLVDAVSIVVDDQPVTLYEIYKVEKQLGLPKEKAVEYMIKQKLKDEELKRLGVEVDEFDVNQEIERIAKKSGIDSLKLRSIMAKRGVDWSDYKKQVKEKLLQERLYERILSTKIQPPSEGTLQEYYQLHIGEFSIPEAIQVIQYSATDRKALKEAMQNPMASVPGVSRNAQMIRSDQVNQQLLFLLTQTPKGKFTQIIPVKGQYVVFYVQEFVNPRPLPYDQVKQQVYAKWMEEKRKEAIKSHFDKLRAAANIKVLRAP